MSYRCAVYWQLQQASPWAQGLAIGLPMLIGGAIALLIVLSLAGKIQPVEIPAKNLATFSSRSR
ncbi:MAG: hypothetical protein KBA96_10945 [Rhodocyclaceae bacterium]|nr:hypothetical protein [Rhodocyclaceae bacterium]